MRHSASIRMVVVTAVSAALVLVQHPAQAHRRPNFYCSDSGDLCQSTREVDGVRKLGLLMAERYFGRFELCVTPPQDITYCDRFRVKDQGDGLWGRDVNWRRHFGNMGRGRYTVKWFQMPKRSAPPWKHGPRIGEILGFRVP